MAYLGELQNILFTTYTIMDKKRVIEGSVLFGGLPQRQLEDISGIAVEKTFQKGEAIFFEGDKGIGFYMVGDGRVKIFKVSPAGKEHILHIFGEGEPFGEVPVFYGQPFPASAEALVKTQTLFFPRDRFIRLVEANPSIALNMLAVLSMRLRRFAGQIESLSLKEVPARLANYLLYLSTEQGDKEVVQLDISKGQLASLLGTIPETLSRIFAKMSEEGLIRVNGRTIYLLDKEALGEKD
jgi:CRP/FNR family transcriptional regulator, dissimilatory nitrate respiration regulator